MAFKHTGHSKSSRTLLDTVILGFTEGCGGSFTSSLTSVNSSFGGGSTSDLVRISSKNGLLDAMLVQAATSPENEKRIFFKKKKINLQVNSKPRDPFSSFAQLT